MIRIGESLLLIVLANVLVLPLLFLLYRSPFGLSLKALREDSLAAQSLGVDAGDQYLAAFTLSAGFAAISGALFAAYVSFIDPTSFDLKVGEPLHCHDSPARRIGEPQRSGNRSAGHAAASRSLRFLQLPDTVAANFREIIYGAILIGLMLFRPQGIAGAVRVK